MSTAVAVLSLLNSNGCIFSQSTDNSGLKSVSILSMFGHEISCSIFSGSGSIVVVGVVGGGGVPSPPSCGKNVNGIFNIGSDDKISKYEFGVLIAEEFGLDKSYIERGILSNKSNLVIRPADMSLSNQKVRELLGRNLGTVKEHIAQLHKQEFENKVNEIQSL